MYIYIYLQRDDMLNVQQLVGRAKASWLHALRVDVVIL